MAHGDAREGNWRGNWRMEEVASTLHTTSEHGVSSITTPDAHTSAASSRPNWRPSRFRWTRPFRRKKKSGFCECAITFQTQSTIDHSPPSLLKVIVLCIGLDTQFQSYSDAKLDRMNCCYLQGSYTSILPMAYKADELTED